MSVRTATAKSKIRLADVAREARLSVSTVSMALADHPHISGPTKVRVRKISQQLGYARAVPAQRRTATLSRLCALKTFGFMVLGAKPDDLTYSGPLYPLTAQVRGAGGRMEVNVVESADVDVELATIRAFCRRLAGLFLVGRVQHHLVAALRELTTPCVILNAVMAQPTDLPLHHAHVVVPDHVQMGRTPTALLAARGHRRIAFVAETITPGLMFSQNLMGYRMVHAELGLAVDERLVHVAGVAGAGGEPAARALSELDEPPTAFLVPNPRLAGSFLQAMGRRGRAIPRDAMFVVSDTESADSAGIGDRPRVYCEASRQAAAGFELLTRLLQGTDPEGTTIVVQPTYANWPPSID